MASKKYHRWPRPAQYRRLRTGDTFWPKFIPEGYCIAPALNLLLYDDEITGNAPIPRKFGRELVQNTGFVWKYGGIVFGETKPTLIFMRYTMENIDFPNFSFGIRTEFRDDDLGLRGRGFIALAGWPIGSLSPDDYANEHEGRVIATGGLSLAQIVVTPSTLEDMWEDDPP